MNSIRFPSEDASYLAAKAKSASLAARELVAFCSEEPELAGQAAIEVLALEAKSILSGGAVERIVLAARSGSPAVRRDDLDAAFRLDTIASLSSSRLSALGVALEGEESDAPMNKLGGIVSIAATVLGMVKTIW
jgi:hypothetical protein